MKTSSRIWEGQGVGWLALTLAVVFNLWPGEKILSFDCTTFCTTFFSTIEIIEQIELIFYHVNLSLFSLRESLLHQKLKYFKIIEIKKTI